MQLHQHRGPFREKCRVAVDNRLIEWFKCSGCRIRIRQGSAEQADHLQISREECFVGQDRVCIDLAIVAWNRMKVDYHLQSCLVQNVDCLERFRDQFFNAGFRRALQENGWIDWHADKIKTRRPNMFQIADGGTLSPFGEIIEDSRFVPAIGFGPCGP